MSLGRRSLANLLGAVLPVAVQVPVVGLLARWLDAESFSLVLLGWALLALAALLDAGTTRALVRQSSLPQADPRLLPTALSFTACSGLLGAMLLWLAAPVAVAALAVDPRASDDAVQGLRLAALALPLLLPTLVLQAHWDAREDFAESNLQRVVAGCLLPLGTLLGAGWGASVSSAMAGMLASRALALALALQRRSLWRLASPRAARLGCLRRLLAEGGWVTVSALASALMNTLDRYLLGWVRGAAGVAAYAAPSDAANKLLTLPVAVTRGLFPALARRPEGSEAEAWRRQAWRWVALVSLPPALLAGLAAGPLLALWLGERWAAPATPVLQCLMLGFVCGAFAQLPFTEVQARGRADASARLHLLELGPFLLLAWALCQQLGALGAAWAWTLRNAADLLLHLALAARLRRQEGGA